MSETVSEARERVLETAAALFQERGYNGVSMRDIADALAIRQASLYYHVPGGKEQLYVEVARRGLQRHQQGLSATMSAAGPALPERLCAAAGWLMSQVPLRLLSMLEMDMPALSAARRQEVTELTFRCLFAPLAAAFEEARRRGEIRALEPERLAGNFLALMDGISYAATSGHAVEPLDHLAREAVDVLLYGIGQPRPDDAVEKLPE